MLDISWSLKSCSLFLIQLIWNHVVKKFKTKPFVSTMEAKIHVVMAIVSLISYPALQTAFQAYNPNFSTIAPQFVSHFENFLIGFFCFAMSYRFKKLIASSKGFQGKAISRLRYYMSLNILLGISVWMDGIFLMVINVDSIVKLTSTPEQQKTGNFIGNSKFALDFLTKLFNFGFIHTYPIAILLLFPFGSGVNESTAGNGISGPNGNRTADDNSLSDQGGRSLSNQNHLSSKFNANSKASHALEGPAPTAPANYAPSSADPSSSSRTEKSNAPMIH